MGVEWIDMLIEKVVQRKEELKNPVVEIGMAVMPTTTFANMKKADSETVSYRAVIFLHKQREIVDAVQINTIIIFYLVTYFIE